MKFPRGSPWLFILSWLNLKANKDYFSYEYSHVRHVLHILIWGIFSCDAMPHICIGSKTSLTWEYAYVRHGIFSCEAQASYSHVRHLHMWGHATHMQMRKSFPHMRIWGTIRDTWGTTQFCAWDDTKKVKRVADSLTRCGSKFLHLYICAAWRIHMWDMTHFCAKDDTKKVKRVADSFTRFECNFLHSYICQNGAFIFMCVTWPIVVGDMTP